jgi:hypothetical protein
MRRVSAMLGHFQFHSSSFSSTILNCPSKIQHRRGLARLGIVKRLKKSSALHAKSRERRTLHSLCPDLDACSMRVSRDRALLRLLIRGTLRSFLSFSFMMSMSCSPDLRIRERTTFQAMSTTGERSKNAEGVGERDQSHMIHTK